jgi:hypothetical protein
MQNSSEGQVAGVWVFTGTPLSSDAVSPFRFLQRNSTGDWDELPNKDKTIGWGLGFYPEKGPSQCGRPIWGLPVNMDKTYLYPESSSAYTLPSGITVNVQCTIPGDAASTMPQIDCPAPFVNPRADDNVEPCIHQCPIQGAYTLEDYTFMRGLSNGVGLLGCSLNSFMAGTWVIAGKQYFINQPYQLRFCVVAELLYSLVATFPSLIMKHDLPCGADCGTEECLQQSSALCAMNRASVHIVLSILINLCVLMFQIAYAIIKGTGYTNQRALNCFSTIVPVLLAFVAYALEVSDINDGGNAELNIARHAFSCSV